MKVCRAIFPSSVASHVARLGHCALTNSCCDSGRAWPIARCSAAAGGLAWSSRASGFISKSENPHRVADAGPFRIHRGCPMPMRPSDAIRASLSPLRGARRLKCRTVLPRGRGLGARSRCPTPPPKLRPVRPRIAPSIPFNARDFFII